MRGIADFSFEKQILELDVAMHNAVLVQVGQSGQNLADDFLGQVFAIFNRHFSIFVVEVE